MPHSRLKCLGQDSRTRKRLESYIRAKQDQREPFIYLLQRLTKAVQIGVTDLTGEYLLNLWLLKMPT